MIKSSSKFYKINIITTHLCTQALKWPRPQVWVFGQGMSHENVLSVHCTLKGIVYAKMKVLSLSKTLPVRPSFIFGTQIKIFLMKSKSFLTLHRQQCNWNVDFFYYGSVSTALWYSRECAVEWHGGEDLLNKVIIFVFFTHKKYSHSFIKLQLNHWCHMDYFNDVLTTFLGLVYCSCIALNGGSESSQISWKIS